MVENGMRLSISVTGSDFTLVDQLTDGMLVYKNGNYIADSLDHVTVIEGLRGVVDQLMMARNKIRLFGYTSEAGDCVILSQHKHGVFSMETGTQRADYDTGVLKRPIGFDTSKVISSLGYIVETLCKTGGSILDLKTSVVRRYVDADLIVVRGSGHEIVVRKCNVYDNVLRNVLYDKEMLAFLYVDIHTEEKVVNFFDASLHLMCTMPYDASFDVYFTSDENTFDSEE